MHVDNKSKVISYTAQYSVLRTVQSALHFTSLTNLFTQTPSRLLWELSSHMLQIMREGCSYTYPPRSIAMNLIIQLSELEQCRVKTLVQGFNTAAQDSNPGSRNRESEALPLSHCALLTVPHSSIAPEVPLRFLLYFKCTVFGRFAIDLLSSLPPTLRGREFTGLFTDELLVNISI